MKAIVWSKYGSLDGLTLEDVPKPTPRDNEVQVKIHATTITAGDYEIRTQQFPLWLLIPLRLYLGVFRPRDIVLGQEFAGEVTTLGQAVMGFAVGDAVVGTTGPGLGAHAEYITVLAQSDEGVLTHKPATVPYEQATAVPVGGLEALYFMRKANIKPGDKVLIVGAGGSIGSYAIQLAKLFGAEVTGIDNSAKQDLMRTLGADHVIDYTREDFTKQDIVYDVIFDVIGKSRFAVSVSRLKPDGRYTLANPRLVHMLRGKFLSIMSKKRVIFGQVRQKEDDLQYLLERIESGQLQVVIDDCYPLERTAEAFHYVETRGKRGNLVISIMSNCDASTLD